jgi:peptidoglycan hydrolase CwlO-like protein
MWLCDCMCMDVILFSRDLNDMCGRVTKIKKGTDEKIDRKKQTKDEYEER